MIKQVGEMSPDEFDGSNVPVDIWLDEIDPEDEPEAYEHGFRYELRVGNYMPRKGAAEPGMCRVRSDNKEELQKLVEQYILPFYKLALSKVEGIVQGTQECLYYWDNDT